MARADLEATGELLNDAPTKLDNAISGSTVSKPSVNVTTMGLPEPSERKPCSDQTKSGRNIDHWTVRHINCWKRLFQWNYLQHKESNNKTEYSRHSLVIRMFWCSLIHRSFIISNKILDFRCRSYIVWITYLKWGSKLPKDVGNMWLIIYLGILFSVILYLFCARLNI